MENKLIPFRAPAHTAPPETNERRSRMIVHLGKQRIAIDISCRATTLTPAPAPAVVPPVSSSGRKRRKERRP